MVKKVRHSGDNNETKKQIRELPGVSASGSGIHEEEINPFVSSLNEGDVIHFVMGITSLYIDQVIDSGILDEWDGDEGMDKFQKILKKATINEGERYDGSGLVGALGDRLLIVMNGGEDKFDFAYNELNGISEYEKSLGQYIRIDRKNENEGEDWIGNIYFEKKGGSWNPFTKSKEGWKGFNEWFPSHLKNLGQRKKREKREREKKGREKKKRKNANVDDKDRVISKSNLGAGGDGKFAQLKELKEMLTEGLIDEDEFKQMKKEILGK